MKVVCLTLFLALAFAASVAQQPTASTERLRTAAIVNLRKLAMAESAYAMGHPDEGFACEAHTLTTVQWPGSSAPLFQPALLSGSTEYRFAVKCAGDSHPAQQISVSAEPLDPKSTLPTYCASGTFQTSPFVGTSEFPVRSVATGPAEACLDHGELLR